MRRIIFLFYLSFVFWSCAGAGDAPLKYKHRPANRPNAPVIIMLHGYGSNEADLFSIQMMPDCHVFSLRGPYQHPNTGYAWFSLDIRGNGQFSYNYDQAKESRKKILAFISWACREFRADSSHVIVVGFSQGAMMGYDLALHAKGKIAGVAALSGGIIPQSKADISLNIKTMPVFIAHGNIDNIVEYSYSVEAKEFLNKQGATVTFKSYNHAHNISGAEVADVSAWIKASILKK
jgi:phospholipase/carboxylesterase